MSGYTDFLVRYPTERFMTSAHSWYAYLLLGFREAGARVEIDPALDAQSRSKLGFQVTAIDVAWRSRTRRVYYDWCDFDKNHPQLIRQHTPEALYFKIMCRPEHRPLGIRPIGQTISRMGYFGFLGDLRAAVKAPPTHDVLAVFRTTNFDLRTRAVEIVRAGPWRSLAFVINYDRRPQAPRSLQGPKLLAYPHHLRAQARSRICLALPGVGGDWTWRHTEILAMGACLLTVEPEYLPVGHADRCWIECRRDLSDLADKLDFWLANDAARQEIAARGRAYYERALSPVASAVRILEAVRRGSAATEGDAHAA